MQHYEGETVSKQSKVVQTEVLVRRQFPPHYQISTVKYSLVQVHLSRQFVSVLYGASITFILSFVRNLESVRFSSFRFVRVQMGQTPLYQIIIDHVYHFIEAYHSESGVIELVAAKGY